MKIANKVALLVAILSGAFALYTTPAHANAGCNDYWGEAQRYGRAAEGAYQRMIGMDNNNYDAGDAYWADYDHWQEWGRWSDTYTELAMQCEDGY